MVNLIFAYIYLYKQDCLFCSALSGRNRSYNIKSNVRVCVYVKKKVKLTECYDRCFIWRMNGAKTNDNEYACEYTAAAAAAAVGSMGVVVVVRCSVFPNGWSSNFQLYIFLRTRERSLVSLQPPTIFLSPFLATSSRGEYTRKLYKYKYLLHNIPGATTLTSSPAFIKMYFYKPCQ